ncbi:MAG TPA: hypothetical protein VIU62_20750 [Chloroflexota bacterium]
MTTDAGSDKSAAPVTEQPIRDFPWMRVPTERNMKPKIGPQGLRIKDIDQGSYAFVPDHWPYKNDLPRGAFPGTKVGLEASYSLFDKCDVWSENAADLYEDAIRDRWASALDVPWQDLKPYPEIAERAICQILTEFSESALVALQVFSGWLERISYGFYEVKSFLATEIYDCGRHHEAFRKRALANGGGLGVQTPGIYHRAITSSMRLTELVIARNIVQTTFQLVVLSAMRDVANNDADRKLSSLIMRDLWRHLDFGIGHVNFYLKMNPTKHDQVHVWLGRAEALLVAEITHDIPFNEAVILLLGDTVEQGRERSNQLRRDFAAAYLHRLYEAGVYNRLERLVPEIRRYLREDAATPTTIEMLPPVPDPLRREASTV